MAVLQDYALAIQIVTHTYYNRKTTKTDLATTPQEIQQHTILHLPQYTVDVLMKTNETCNSMTK